MSQFYQGKKVWVSGGASFVGSNLIERLLELGADVTAILHNKKTVAIQENRITYIQATCATPKTASRRLKNSGYVSMCGTGGT